MNDRNDQADLSTGWSLRYWVFLLLGASILTAVPVLSRTHCGRRLVPLSVRAGILEIVTAQEEFRRRSATGRSARSIPELVAAEVLPENPNVWKRGRYRTTSVGPDFTVTVLPEDGDLAYFRDRNGTLRHDLRTHSIGPGSPELYGHQPPRIRSYRKWSRWRAGAASFIYWSLVTALVATLLHGTVWVGRQGLLLVREGTRLLPTRNLIGSAHAACEKLGFERHTQDGLDCWTGSHRDGPVRVTAHSDSLRVEAMVSCPETWAFALGRRGALGEFLHRSDDPFDRRFVVAYTRPSSLGELIRDRETAGQCLEAGRRIRLRKRVVELEGTRPVSPELVRTWIETVVFLAEILEERARILQGDATVQVGPPEDLSSDARGARRGDSDLQ